MTNEKKYYDAIVIGSGHAGTEACMALARKGIKTLLLTLNLDSIAFLACNPSIGGTAKGHLVCEIDALGGIMGIVADANTIQRRMLNSSRGAAVQSLRAQIDKIAYHTSVKKILEEQENLFIRQGEASEILVEEGKVCGVKTLQGEEYSCKTVIVATGVYLNSRIIVGEYTKFVGPNGFSNSSALTENLIKLNFSVRRFKTGTPARVHGKTIDYTKLEVQKGEDNIQAFSFITQQSPKNIIDCYLTYTTKETHQFIKDNIHLAPMYSGKIKSQGARYCPSIEDKIVRFADKERHQLFLEPEALSTNEVYIQGFSTSLPSSIQEKMVRSLPGLEKAHIMRDAYAIEYDCIDSVSLFPSLESKNIKGLFFAGQVNGTSGYEEAAAQGLVAGINGAQYILGEKPLILSRDNSYIGVLIDDLVTKGTNEPYRMMTSRAEYRLYLRQDNADLRLTEIGREFGLVDDFRYDIFLKRKADIEKIFEKIKKHCSPKSEIVKIFNKKGESFPSTGISIKDAIRRPNIFIEDIVACFPEDFKEFNHNDLKQVEIQLKYQGYLSRQQIQIQQAQKNESLTLPEDINYDDIKGLRIEARQKLNKIKPLNLGQASRISGVNPADIAVLLIYLKAFKR